MRVIASDPGLREVDSIDGRRRYHRGRDGSFQVNDAADVKSMLAWGCFVPSILGTANRSVGYRCSSCGFGTWFKTCSRCGGTAVREG